jgi:hypothetical protein
VTAVVIGVDPHKGSPTAVAVSADERQLGRRRVRAPAGQAQRLAGWAAAWPERTWAVEGAAGLRHLLGHLLARQLAAAGGRGHEQERPERRPVGRGRRVALGWLPPGAAR